MTVFWKIIFKFSKYVDTYFEESFLDVLVILLALGALFLAPNFINRCFRVNRLKYIFTNR